MSMKWYKMALNSPLMVGCVICDMMDGLEQDNLNCLVKWRMS